jgi:hypothetical protein
MLACQGRRDLRSNDLFDRANQRVVGLIGRVRMRNSPYGRAQRFGNEKLTGSGPQARDPVQRLVKISLFSCDHVLHRFFLHVRMY